MVRFAKIILLLVMLRRHICEADEVSDFGDVVDLDRLDLDGDGRNLPDDDDDEQQNKNDHVLKLVHVLYRHGDRSPIHTYANDIYKESDWPQGLGQLTIFGMQQEYVLGQFLRKRYIDCEFLSPDYNRAELYVRSTSYDRALMSAYSVLAGLYPPNNNYSIWNEEIPWQPIPVHNIDPLEDDTLLVTKMPCPVFEVESKKFTNSSEQLQEIMAENPGFFQYVSDNAGVPNTWEGVDKVLDPLFCESENGFGQPEWVTSEVFDQILQLRDLHATLACPPQVANLKAGLLLGEILQHMINKSKHDISPSQKMFMYSAHDTNVECLLVTLGVFDNVQPPYTACVIVELLEGPPGDLYVQILYKNSTVDVRSGDMDSSYRYYMDEDPVILTIPNCDSLCPLEQFAQLVKSSIPSDIKKACGSAEEIMFSQDQRFSVLLTVINIVLMILIILVLAIVGIICCWKRNGNTHDYMPVPMEMT